MASLISRIDPFLVAQRRHNILPIWDLCHYGYPDDLDPLRMLSSPASRLMRRPRRAMSPIAPTMGHCASHRSTNRPSGAIWEANGPGARPSARAAKIAALHLALARADIAAVKAIRADFPDTRIVHIDPLIWVVPPRDRPDLAEAAHRESYDDAYLAWDMISGLKHPEYGGSSETIDIIGLNNYSFGQMEYASAARNNPAPAWR